MKKILLATMLAFASTAATAGAYLGGGGSYTKFDVDGSTEDQDTSAAFVRGGWMFNQHFGTELEAKRTLDEADVAGPIQIDEQTTYTLYGVGKLPFDGTPVNLVLKGGAGYADTKIKGFGLQDSDTTWYPALAGGIEWNVTENWSTDLMVDYKKMDYSVGGSDIGMDPISFNLGVNYNF